ncbi:MAG: hypothetical protein QGH60_25275, partial [Phycisphaerae bacterium]|nr:hypothetical protein [Phycisphaerae bacterium]
DAWGNRAELYRDPDTSCYQPVPLRPRRKPTTITPVDGGEAKDSSGMGTVFMLDVYQGLTGIMRGRVKHLRVMEALPLTWNACGKAGGISVNLQAAAVSLGGDVHLKKVHGIVPVCEDGSASFTVPPYKNLYFQALDENYMELQRMRSFINLMPGEKRSCIGCHEQRRYAPGVKRPEAMSLPT